MPEWTPHDVGDDILLESMPVGFAEANCFILSSRKTKDAVVIDPGTMNPEETAGIVSRVKELGVDVRYIVNTHGHPDHMSGNDFLKAAVGGEVMIHELDGFKLTDPVRNSSRMFGFDVYVSPADVLVKEGDSIEIGDVSLTVIHTPGHSSGGIALLGDGFVFTGDTLFAGSIGRSDLPCSSEENTLAYEVLLQSIGERLLSLPDETLVFPGHGPSTTIGNERRTNPFVK